MWQIGEHRYDQYAKVWDVEDHGTYAIVSLGTSRKTKEKEYINSNWKFVRFVGTAYKDIMEVEPKTTIVIKQGGISSEPYMDKSGNKVWPKYPQIVVFAWDYPDTDGAPKSSKVEEEEEFVDEDELPF